MQQEEDVKLSHEQQQDPRLTSEGSSDSYNEQYAYEHLDTPVTVNLIELAIVALGASISAAKPIQRLSLHPLYADEDTLYAARGPSFPCEDDTTHTHTHQNHHRREDSIRLKLDGTVVTDADGAAQRIICSSLQQTCRHVRIVAEESKMEAELSTHNVRDRVWSGLSPVTKRRLMTEEEEEQDDIMNGARQEIYHRIQQVTRKRNWSTRDQFSSLLMEDDKGDLHIHDKHDNNKNEDEDIVDLATLLPMYNVDSQRVAFFVDPLDGTGCYAKGEYDAVTILTAIVLDNTPIFGIICKPFAIDMMGGSCPNHNELGVFESKSTVFQHNPVDFTHTFLNSGCFAVYGGTLLQGAFIAGDKELEASRLFYQEQEKSSTTVDDDYAHRKAIISKSRSGGVVAKCIESLASSGLLSSEPIHIAGAGYKALRLLLGYDKECLWFFPKPGTSLWDVAAADALLQVVGGRLTDKYSKPLDYSKARLEAENLDGIVASNDSLLHEICIQRFQDEAWSDDEE